jgi:putative transposase
MPRKPRIQFEGAFYHLFHRGNRRERIFLDDRDYARFEAMLFDAVSRSNVRLFRWCLMPNHFHLLVETPEGNVAEFMSRLLTRYAQYFNRRYDYVGHVFQGRYGARVCDKEAYFLELIKYLELNAYKSKSLAGGVLGAWKWSSHRYTMMPKSQWPVGVRRGFQEILDRFSQDAIIARKRYAEFLSDGLKNAHWEDFYKTKDGRFLGNDVFIEKTKRQANEPKRQRVRTYRKLTSIEQLIGEVTQLSGLSAHQLGGPSRAQLLNQWRIAFVCVGRFLYRFPVSALARAIGRDPSAVSQMFRRNPKWKEAMPAQRLIKKLAL